MREKGDNVKRKQHGGKGGGSVRTLCSLLPSPSTASRTPRRTFCLFLFLVCPLCTCREPTARRAWRSVIMVTNQNVSALTHTHTRTKGKEGLNGWRRTQIMECMPAQSFPCSSAYRGFTPLKKKDVAFLIIAAPSFLLIGATPNSFNFDLFFFAFFLFLAKPNRKQTNKRTNPLRV